MNLRDGRRTIATALMGPWRTAPIIISLVAIAIFFNTQSSLFLSSRNLTNLANQIAVLATVALALVGLLVVRQIDLSLAALAAVCGGIAAKLSVESNLNVGLAIVVALAAGAAVGVVQAVVVNVFRAPAFVVTLGGMFVLNAVLLWLLPATSVIPLADTPLEKIANTFVPAWLSYVLLLAVVLLFAGMRFAHHRARLGEGMPSNLVRSTVIPAAALAAVGLVPLIFVFNAYRGVPTPVVIVLALMAGIAYVTSQTPLGRQIYAIGGNPEGARRAGISVPLVTTVVFATGGFLAATAGIMAASRELGVSSANSDLTLLLEALAAVVIGGVSLFGGRGTVWAALLGSLVIGSISNGLYLLNASTQMRWTIEGLVLVAAVAIDSTISRKSGAQRDS
ncbi:sugar ABC transporter permease [Phytohabitans flavus]|uniref:Xylose transport system permease protein XylH n=1 Tax=Phytohabitans flavus TaxID=1076124 RepID=A0A6F8XLW8_9ACTN|nr:inner-membrane translocator [Phytohabitans flavus]BCB74806.1 xylose ABC transporter permease [Phytohabitans flavus]